MIEIDINHRALIYGLLVSHKPDSCLELGIGTGLTTSTIIDAVEFNKKETSVDCVDNFYDWKGICPPHIQKLNHINLIISDEYSFVSNCTKKYDFIISDADHFNAHKWIDKTIDILNSNGILIYHDISNKSFPNLYSILQYVEHHNITHMLFNQNSRKDEQCDRGLLVINKR